MQFYRGVVKTTYVHHFTPVEMYPEGKLYIRLVTRRYFVFQSVFQVELRMIVDWYLFPS